MGRKRPVIGIEAEFVHETVNAKEKGRVRLWAEYSDAIVKAGGAPLILPATAPPELAGDMLDRVDGLLISGGPDISPARFGSEPHPSVKPLLPRREDFAFRVFEEAERRDMPILAICLGIQVVNVGRGGTLVQDIPSQLETTIKHRPDEGEDYPEHPAHVAPDTLLASIVGAGEITVNSSHHQAIERVGEGLVVTARAEDGIIECLEDPTKRFLLGIQWHPERLTDRPRHLALFEALVEAARP